MRQPEALLLFFADTSDWRIMHFCTATKRKSLYYFIVLLFKKQVELIHKNFVFAFTVLSLPALFIFQSFCEQL